MNDRSLASPVGAPRSVDLDDVRRRVAEVHAWFYDGALAGLPLDARAVPFLVIRPEGVSDRFTLDIDYSRYPLMFRDAFPGVPGEALLEMCVVAQLFAEALVAFDKVLDRQLRSDSQLVEAVALLGSQRKLACALGLLYRRFPAESRFWSHFDRLHAAYVAQVVKEKLAGGVEAPTLAALEQTAAGKVAMAKIVTAGLAELSGRYDRLAAAEASQDLYAVGYQIYDDVKDWRVDYEARQYSFLLRKALRDLGLEARGATGKRPTADEIGRLLHGSDLIGETLGQGAGYLRRAREAAAPLECRAWVSWIATMEKRLERLRDDLGALRARALERARVRASPRSAPGARAEGRLADHAVEAVRRGIHFLQAQQRADYVEGAHLEMLPPAQVRDPTGPVCHFGKVFVRAVALHTLALARRSGYLLEQPVFERDLDRLVDARLADRRGGWSYFPEMALPPDCDDLGEILHVLVAVGDSRVGRLCDDAICLAAAAQLPDGAIPTWIADPADPLSVQSRAAVVAVWGPGLDVEVMANLLHGLWLYDAVRFAGTIARGAEYVAARQDASGSWTSTWYVGPFYGTWACGRLLAAVGRSEGALRRAESFLLDAQSAGGGWGPDDDALDTSFALMALDGALARPPERRDKAVRTLLEAQRENGAWSGTPFIKMDAVPRKIASMPGFQEELHTSDTLATAAAVRALATVVHR